MNIIKDLILRSDVSWWDGILSTRSKRDSTGGTITSLKLGVEVDVLQVYGGGVNYNDSTITKATEAIGSRSVTLVFQPGTWTISNSVTVGSNFTVRVPNGVVFSVDSGKTLTFSGPVIRDGQTWTGGSGTVTENGTRYLSGKIDVSNAVLQGATPLVFEGATDNAFETSFVFTDPTADRTVTFPDANVDFSNVVTAAGSYTFSGNNTFSGASTFSGTATFSASPKTENLINGICEGRLTLTSGTPVTTADVTAAETVYFTPYKGNRISVYDGTNWELYSFSELSIDVPDATQVQDVFIYSNSGTLTLELTTWTNDTTRATALTIQDGVYVKTGATTRRYLGTFYSTIAGNGQTEDSAANRYLWNYYNRVERTLISANETANSWTYTTATIRQANANTANQLNFVVGVAEDAVSAFVHVGVENSSAAVTVAVGIGVDSTTANSANVMSKGDTNVANRAITLSASYRGMPGVGKRFLAWLEYSQAGVGTTAWWGDANTPTLSQSGITGHLLG